jgi:hypothetical protein
LCANEMRHRVRLERRGRRVECDHAHYLNREIAMGIFPVYSTWV